MMTKVAPGKYRVRVYAYGREVYSRVHTGTDKEARAAAIADEASWNTRLAGGSFVDPRSGKVPVGKVLDEFLVSRPGQVAPKTLATGTYLLGLVTKAFRRLPLGMVDASDVAAELGRHNARLSRSSLDRMKSILSMAFKYAIAKRWREGNPVTGVRTPDGRTDQAQAKMWPFSLDELREVVADLSAVHPDGEIALFLALTGLRWGEMAALRVRDVVFVPGRSLMVGRSKSTGQPVRSRTKTGADRIVPLVDEAWAIVAGRMDTAGDDSDALLFTTQGRPLGGWAWKCRVRWGTFSRGRRVHDLRHTAATMWLSSGLDVKMVQAWMGHKTASMTLDRYGHYLPGAGAAGVARMNEVLAATGTSPAPAPVAQVAPRAGSAR